MEYSISDQRNRKIAKMKNRYRSKKRKRS